jgi:hypothetical protein
VPAFDERELRVLAGGSEARLEFYAPGERLEAALASLYLPALV